ncbi:MAG: 1-deoxy-D-xylulose-5-phosphate synthase [Leisingera sp.]
MQRLERSGRKIGREENRDFAITLPASFNPDRSRVMYIEDKSDGLDGPARIGRVYFSKSGKSLYYQGRVFKSLKGSGFKANYFDVETGDHFWISGPRKDQNDRLYGGFKGVEIDEDAREEYAELIQAG